MRSGQFNLALDLFGLNRLMQTRLVRHLSVHYIDATRLETHKDQEPSALGLIIAARRARIPAKVMQLIAHVVHAQLVDDLRVSGTVRIGVYGRQSVWFTFTCVN